MILIKSLELSILDHIFSIFNFFIKNLIITAVKFLKIKVVQFYFKL